MTIDLYILVSYAIAQCKPVGNLLSHFGMKRLTAPSYGCMSPIILGPWDFELIPLFEKRFYGSCCMSVWLLFCCPTFWFRFSGCGLSGEYCYAAHKKSGFLSNSNAHNTTVVIIWNININIAFLFAGLVTLLKSKMHGDYFAPMRR